MPSGVQARPVRPVGSGELISAFLGSWSAAPYCLPAEARSVELHIRGCRACYSVMTGTLNASGMVIGGRKARMTEYWHGETICKVRRRRTGKTGQGPQEAIHFAWHRLVGAVAVGGRRGPVSYTHLTLPTTPYV